MAALTALNLSPVVVQSGDGEVFQFPGESEARKFEQSSKEAGGATLRLVPERPLVARGFYHLEDTLAALVESVDTVPAEQRAEYDEQVQQYTAATREKRDHVGQLRQYLQQQVEAGKKEKDRITKRTARFERALAWLDYNITRAIVAFGGGKKKLEGKVVTLGLHGCDKRLDVTDETAVPLQYKRAIVTMPAELWQAIRNSLDFDLLDRVQAEAKEPNFEVTGAAKQSLKDGLEVPGARLIGGTYVQVK